MIRAKNTPSVVELDEYDITRIMDVIEEELEVGGLDFEQRDALQRVVLLSIGMYLMILRENTTKTSKLTQ